MTRYAMCRDSAVNVQDYTTSYGEGSGIMSKNSKTSDKNHKSMVEDVMDSAEATGLAANEQEARNQAKEQAKPTVDDVEGSGEIYEDADERARSYARAAKEIEDTPVKLAEKVKQKELGGVFYAVARVATLLMFFLMFIPDVSPTKMSELISGNLSLFTAGVSYSSLISDVGRGFRRGWVSESNFQLLFAASIITMIAIVAISVAACLSLGNSKCKRLSFVITLIGSIAAGAGLVMMYVAYTMFAAEENQDKVGASFPTGIIVFAVLAVIVLICNIIAITRVPKPAADERFEMEAQYKLFVMFIPFAMLAFVFCYLPLWGWRYAFFDYKAGDTLSMDKWVGLKWFKYLFQNDATKRDIVRVLRNTLAMSFLGIATSWVPLAFAVFLTELPGKTFKRIVQTITTVPNFISWILVYTIALAIFSTDGFVNTMLTNMGNPSNTNYLMSDEHTWLKMLAWGLWKGVGWSAIIYIAGISGIDRQLYEAATVDGAGRFQRIWHVTLPGLIPTYMVMLLMSVAGMLSNGLDQYLVFSNAKNSAHMEVLDLYVYNLGFAGGSIPLSTVIGMAKSIISVALLFMANSISKLVRHESIV